jgi:hypothetical protein
LAQSVWDHSTFSKNRDRLLIARDRFEVIVGQAWVAILLSDEHFNVDDTIIAAWASQKSFGPQDGFVGSRGGAGRNDVRDFREEQRSNDMHASAIEAEAKLYKETARTPSKLTYLRHEVSEYGNGLTFAAQVTQPSGTAKRSGAFDMLDEMSGAT